MYGFDLSSVGVPATVLAFFAGGAFDDVFFRLFGVDVVFEFELGGIVEIWWG